ncbi:class 1 fructose-bisphosphatase [Rhodoblastus sp.]|uniref:class 1 fructose-bisphosphatase n=1 Tax=Rhodoblastus sp. TaxID=1962975 RepID=UPI003F953EB0
MASIEAPALHAAGEGLVTYLQIWRAAHPGGESLSGVLTAMAEAGAAMAHIVLRGPLMGAMGVEIGQANAFGDRQRRLDLLADGAVASALRRSSTAYYASEEEDAILTLRPGGDLAVAVDPLDGSSNIDANISVGTIFSVFPASPAGATASFLRPGSEQLAAGYIIYGPHTALLFTLGEGVAHFVLDPETGEFRLIADGLRIDSSTRDYAINASNYRHWTPPVRTFVDDCIAGIEGPRGKDFNMRWMASLVAETHRIFMRGGVFLYPGDQRPAYEHGRLRLLYEANPIALLVEQAGGAASDGYARVLEHTASTLHQRTPLIFGSVEKVARISSYFTNCAFQSSSSPLFGERGLFHT